MLQTSSPPPSHSSVSPRKLSRAPLEDSLIKYIAHSRLASRVLRLLAAQSRPVGYQRLMDGLRFTPRWSAATSHLPAGAIRAVLNLMQAAGLIRLTRDGFSITQIGREVQRRIDLTGRQFLTKPTAQDNRTPTPHLEMTH